MSGKRQNLQYSLALVSKGWGEAPVRGHQGTETSMAKPAPESPACAEQLMEEVCDRGNLERAWKRVRSNKGGLGVDGMTIEEAKGYLREHWPDIRSQAGGRGQKARRALRCRQADPASLAAASPGAVGLEFLPAQLRLPTGAIRSPGGGPGATIHRRGLQRGG